ncbi:MAG: sodium:calcium antiporter [Candidatus Edwardsbacteria bacterium]|nr:sodium:calcium antiporter [Candidatus Edwardsbacteria bacterium]
MILTWVTFLALVSIIIAAGSRLTRYGEQLGNRLGLSGSWIGLVLLSAVTSIPELFSSISSSVIVHQADLALGDLLGSCMANMLIYALLGMMRRSEPLHVRAGEVHALSAGLAIFALALAGIGLVTSRWLTALSLFDMGVFAYAIVIFYMVAQRMLFSYERRQGTKPYPEDSPGLSTRQIVARFSIAAAIVIASGLLLPKQADDIARQMGWGRSFVGGFLLAAATSSPELVVSVSALRMGQVGMSIGNIFGSCIFNVGLIFVNDLFYRGSILADASPANTIIILMSIAMVATAQVGLLFRAERKAFAAISWDSLVIMGLYAAGLVLVFNFGKVALN